MLIVKSNSGEIFYRGVDIEDCERNMPANKQDYLTIPDNRYDDYIDHLVAQQELQDEGGQ